MKVINYKNVPPETIEEGARGVQIRYVITEDMGAENFAMRHFEISPDGFTPLHSHVWEHEVFILSGSGTVVGDGTEKPFGQGDAIFVPANETHQFKNSGKESLSLLCLIPSKERCNL
jgi:quercetin dioxygenase-like cupin family protein